MTTQTQPDTHLRGPVRVVVQIAWLVLVGLIVVVFAAGVPARLRQLLSIADDATPDGPTLVVGLPSEWDAVLTLRLGVEEAGALQALGLSLGFYAGYILAFEVALALAYTAIGIFIFWRRSDDWMALWVSLLLVVMGTNAIAVVVPALFAVWPDARLISIFAGMLGMVSLLHVLFLSPDGRFVPRWTMPIAAGSAGWILAALGVPVLLLKQDTAFFPIVLASLAWLGGLGLGVLAQVYRYTRFSGPVQRQQTKWVVIGLTSVVVGLLLNSLFYAASSQQPGLPRLLYNLIRSPVLTFCLGLLPVCLTFSILRYRLWDIDVLIRRTLQYSVLSGLLALVYFGLIVVLQSIFTAFGGGRSEFVAVASTLAIAALFFPLRNRVQAFIDRRFYRQKYDEQTVLAGFAATCRDETDLGQLAARLTAVVQETMQPESVGLWMRAAKGARSVRNDDSSL
ncbi:MAG: hypothetical protein ACT4QE_19100 [Anaerolineales bacterium]